MVGVPQHLAGLGVEEQEAIKDQVVAHRPGQNEGGGHGGGQGHVADPDAATGLPHCVQEENGGQGHKNLAQQAGQRYGQAPQCPAAGIGFFDHIERGRQGPDNGDQVQSLRHQRRAVIYEIGIARGDRGCNKGDGGSATVIPGERATQQTPGEAIDL